MYTRKASIEIDIRAIHVEVQDTSASPMLMFQSSPSPKAGSYTDLGRSGVV